MDKNELAREAAADLAAQFGPEIVTRTEQAIRGELPVDTAETRGWEALGVGLHVVTLLIELAPIAAARWPQLKNVPVLKAVLKESVKEAWAAQPEIANKVIDAVVRQVSAKD